MISDDQGSTYDDSDTSGGRDAPQPHASVNGKNKIAPAPRPARARNPVKVTDADLRAMAQYIFEKGDDAEVRRYSYPRWREFAERPEVGLTRTESASASALSPI